MRLSSRIIFFLLAAASFGLLASGLLIGEWAKLQPCHLCNFQRLLYIVTGVFALCGVIAPGWRRLWGALVALSAAYGVFTAIQQSWMQYAPDRVAECGFGDPTLTEQLFNWLGVQWPSMFMVTGFCTNKEWVFLGLSLANWSGLAFAVLLAVALRVMLRSARSRY